MINTLIYKHLDSDLEPEACDMCKVEIAEFLYIPSNTLLCLHCKLENDCAIDEKRYKRL